MGVQTEKWNVLIKDFDGAETARDSDDIPDGKSPDLLNVRITGSHARGSRGYELAGQRRSDPGEILSRYTYERLDGEEVMVQLRDTGAAAVLEWYDEVNDEYYTLLAGFTTGKKMGFAEFNTSATNQMIFCNGVQNMGVWTGSRTRLTAAVLAGAIAIPVESTANFPATGTIIYNGTEIAYLSKTDTSFEVANAHASAGANDGVAETADDSTHSGVTKGNILLSAKDRLWIAGQPSAPSALDYSDEGDAFAFTGGANRADSGTEDFFNLGGRITGLGEKDEEIIVLGPNGGDGFKFTYPTSTTKAPLFRKIFRGKGTGCTSPGSVVEIDQEVYFANKNGYYAIGDLEGSDKIFTFSLTREVKPTMQGFDFSEAEAIYYDKEEILLIACKSDADFPGNDIVIGLEFYKDRQGNDRIGITYFDWPAGCWSILADELYFGSSLEQNSFKGFSTYQNDGSPRTVRYSTKRFNFGEPFQDKNSPYAGVRGMIKAGTDIDVLAQYNKGFLGNTSKIIKSDGTDSVTGAQKGYVSAQQLNAIGTFALGLNPMGALREVVSELKEFDVVLDLGVDYAWRDIDLVFESETDGGTFLISHIGMSVDVDGFAVKDNLAI
jgi:hypothetical protein